LLSPYAGLLVDRHSRRRVLLVTQAGLGLVSAVLGVSALTGNIRLWRVVVLPRARGQLREGLRYAASIPAIARPLLMMALVGTFTFEFEVSLPLLARSTFHGGDIAYSWLIGALGAGRWPAACTPPGRLAPESHG
jgi:MFS family permease